MRLDVDGGAALQQVFDHRDLFGPHGVDQRGEPDSRRLQVDKGARVQEQPRCFGHPALSRKVQGRRAHAGVERMDVRARRDQQINRPHVAAACGDMQRRTRQRPAIVHIRAAPNKLGDPGKIVRMDRSEQFEIQFGLMRHLLCPAPFTNQPPCPSWTERWRLAPNRFTPLQRGARRNRTSPFNHASRAAGATLKAPARRRGAHQRQAEVPT